jgi:hypothetical protein
MVSELYTKNAVLQMQSSPILTLLPATSSLSLPYPIPLFETLDNTLFAAYVNNI